MKGLFQQINKNLTFADNLVLIVINIAYSIYVHLILPIGIKNIIKVGYFKNYLTHG